MYERDFKDLIDNYCSKIESCRLCAKRKECEVILTIEKEKKENE